MADKKNNFGKDFERAFSEGLENNDWSLLNDVIVKSVDNFLDGVGDKMNDAMGNSHPNAVPLSKRREDFSAQTQTARAQRKLHAERQLERQRMAQERLEREKARKERQMARKRGPVATELAFPYRDAGGGATALSVTGGIGLGVSGFALLKAGITGIVTGIISGGAVAGALAFIIGFSVLLGKGLGMASRTDLARRYVQLIGKRQYIDVATLALATNKSEKRVVRELKKLINAGYFPQGHFDRNYKTFILTDDVFNHYLELETKGAGSDIIDTTARSEDEQEFPSLSPEESAELSRMIREGNDYVTRFHSLNDDIPGIEISAKLDRLEGLLKEIFVSIRKHPEQMKRIHELMEYYLPTAEKLVKAYKEYDSVSEPGKEILSAKKDIENTLDTINSALGKLLNKLFKDSVLDVTTDAQVLQTILVQKGLTTGMEPETKGDKK
ncbi:MAG: 5-bromo-4-chloroindolyl phosphate hydrolysis family protein [Lachnospiraceae bacterium]|nr:5-bromo-4-chloroindolyl phosphate hydrolysis family protein [Lachnospiraceae bacterium]